jgi:3-(3-hydroxy-phenyl)propionate hydroxylase
VVKDEDRVLIAGAGPAGMCAAMALAMHGVPVLVCEAAPDLPTDLRASTFHPATLDLLDAFAGVTRELSHLGLIARYWQYRDRATGPIATWDMGLLRHDTNHPYRLQTEQWRLTRILQRKLAAFPHAELRFGHAATGASQDGARAFLHVATPEGERKFAGRYLIGCDGANSAVRRALDIPYEGITFPELYFSISTGFEFMHHLADLTFVNYFADPAEWCVLLRTVVAWRVLVPTRPEETREEILSDESVQRRLNAIVPRAEPYEIVHRTLYHVHERVADKYRLGRIFLAGDACHINNPLGGMGMNGSIQDAFNLAAKLVKVWRGEADDASLDRYERQRRKMAIDFVQANAVRNREALRETDPALRARRHDEMRRMADDPERAREFLLRSSMIEALRASEAIA